MSSSLFLSLPRAQRWRIGELREALPAVRPQPAQAPPGEAIASPTAERTRDVAAPVLASPDAPVATREDAMLRRAIEALEQRWRVRLVLVQGRSVEGWVRQVTPRGLFIQTRINARLSFRFVDIEVMQALGSAAATARRARLGSSR